MDVLDTWHEISQVFILLNPGFLNMGFTKLDFSPQKDITIEISMGTSKRMRKNERGAWDQGGSCLFA